jgi:hypothetical protein
MTPSHATVALDGDRDGLAGAVEVHKLGLQFPGPRGAIFGAQGRFIVAVDINFIGQCCDDRVLMRPDREHESVVNGGDDGVLMGASAVRD